MTPEEIQQHAKRIVGVYLGQGIEFDWVYEDYLLENAEGDWEAIHNAANAILERIKL